MKKSKIGLFLATLFLMLSGLYAQTTAPLNEGFEDGTLPDDWKAVTTSTSYAGWNVTNQTGSGSGYFQPHAGNYYVTCHYGSGMSWIMTPKMTPDEDNNTFKFWLAKEGSYTSNLEIRLSTTTQDTAAFTKTLKTITHNDFSAAKTYYQFSVDLSDYQDQEVYIAFRNINSSGDFYLDDVTGPLVEVTACQKPKLTIADITAKDAKLTWTGSEDADGYKVYYKLSTETAYQSVEVSDAELVFSDEDVELKPASMYNVYVEYTCPDDDETMTSAVYTFMTACVALTEEDLPKKWDFETGNTAGTTSYPLPVCWVRQDSQYPYVYNDSYGGGYTKSGTYCLRF
ncbi:MAG: choice-of-anchor J domain-containing protein, partial [Bacteroidales bacterium]|nr:choice-of-anchor J domain-containing protein [Bacteroidales bacterium]